MTKHERERFRRGWALLRQMLSKNSGYLHFVGVATDQYWSAVRVFGKPDFIHEGVATWSMLGDIPRDDMVVFGRKAFTKGPRRRRTAHKRKELGQ